MAFTEYLVRHGVIPDPYEDEGLRDTRSAHERREVDGQVLGQHWVKVICEIYSSRRVSRREFSIRARVFAQEAMGWRYAFTTALVDALLEAGYALALLSHAPHEIARSIAGIMGFHHAVGNALLVDGQGIFTGGARMPSKEEEMQRLVRQFGYSLDRAIAVGDSPADLPMLRRAQIGIAFNPTPGMVEALRYPRCSLIQVLEGKGRVDALTTTQTFANQPSLYSPARLEDYLPAPIASSIRAKLAGSHALL